MLLFVLSMQKMTMFLPAALYFLIVGFFWKNSNLILRKSLGFLLYLYLESYFKYVNFDQPNMVCYYSTSRFCNSSLGATPPGPKPFRCSRLVIFKSTYKSVSAENISILHNL